jgi:hypothetical protein
MKTANWLTFTTYRASLRPDTNDPTRTIFGNIDWSLIHSLAKRKYSTRGAEGYAPSGVSISLRLPQRPPSQTCATAWARISSICLIDDGSYTCVAGFRRA